ncbi:unnamed protein product [Notodromas monacha]|uniref:V-type proton ATPase subunit a n=1 Tax=Notodromas monacha TaxID=399045 RepID=A0A7R9BHP3_9CRUS|nr:unnamed protein product [Notodromas monacha]CAG0914283.1 unnamed protein product [Notodromas monacha]
MSGSVFRSEPMCLCELLLEVDAAYFCVAELGELGLVQFQDLNKDVNAFSRRYAQEVAKCDQLEQKLNELESKVRAEGIRIPRTGPQAPAAPAPQELDAMVGIFDRLAAEQKTVEKNAATLKIQYIELHELLDVLSAAEVILPYEECDGRDYLVGQGSLSFLAGVLHTERSAAFERMIWRVCRGKAFVKTHNISADCPVMPSIEGVISQTHIHRQAVLKSAARTLRTWRLKVMKTKAIYHVLNGFRSNVASTALIAECWVPRDDVKVVQDVLRTGMEKSGSRVPPILNCICTNEPPPTYFKGHCITEAFQDMIDSFGTGSYRELNPSKKFFKNYMDIYCSVIPQLFFLCSLFGYLVFMIFKKWTVYSSENSACAPSILMMFIDMVLMKDGSRQEDCEEPYLFTGQLMMQHFLLFVALACIPWLLFMKAVLTLPKQVCKEELLIKARDDYKKTDVEAPKETKEQFADDDSMGVKVHEPDSDAVIEKFIEGMIHGIEFVLGTVSHIASYLRLWALSLAHAQLSEVLWKMVLSVGVRASFNSNNMFYSGALVAATFFLWAVFTLALLVCMEGLSAYLHTLRLHWVEFMSKFYEGQGHAFLPFCFNAMARLAVDG